jgi:hypothetical protein
MICTGGSDPTRIFPSLLRYVVTRKKTRANCEIMPFRKDKPNTCERRRLQPFAHHFMHRLCGRQPLLPTNSDSLDGSPAQPWATLVWKCQRNRSQEEKRKKRQGLPAERNRQRQRIKRDQFKRSFSTLIFSCLTSLVWAF